jgi:uncharacterized protein (TIGR03083 family)
MTSSDQTQATVMAALRASQERLAHLLTGLPDDQVKRQAYPSDWTIAQVASHLGSQAETFLLSLAAGLEGTPAPGVDQFRPIWDRWNAKPPSEQVTDALRTDAVFLDTVDALSEEQRAAWRLNLMGSERDLSGLLRLRLGEHILHTWDIEVVLDPSATLPSAAAALVVELLPTIVQYTAKPTARREVRVETVEPGPALRLLLSPEGSQLETVDPPVTADREDAALRLPTEALVRLVYGRLRVEHTPATVQAEPALLDTLRSALPGV